MRLVIDDARALPEASRVFDQVLARVDEVASRFRPDSQLQHANRNAGRPTPVGRELVDLISTALAAARDSNGLVDPTLGADLARWGYDRDITAVGESIASPPADSLIRTRSSAGWQHVILNAEMGLLTVPLGVQLDLGATAKARTADLLAGQLAERFATGVLVELGGDLAVAGPHPGGWPISVAEQEGGGGDVVVLTGGGLATSTTTVRRWQHNGRQAHHLLDPRTGSPAEGPWRTVTVAAPSTVAANTASTAAIVLGADARSWLRQRGLAARLVDRRGSVVTTPGWPDHHDGESAETSRSAA